MHVRVMECPGFEEVRWCADPDAGYRAFLVMHSTAAGPAVGGTRLRHYASEGQALDDALRLARGMTAKNLLAGIPLGGGKSVIMAPAGRFDRRRLMAAHGRAVADCGGRYITAEDVGTTASDMDTIARETGFVAGRAGGRAGDPSPFTARGVHRAMQAGAEFIWGTADLAGRRVALQGLGKVGMPLLELLVAAGAEVVATDLDASRFPLARHLGATIVHPDRITLGDAEIFCPCALGGVLGAETAARLRARLVVGGANNQLARDADGDELFRRGVWYVPDYVANAGGVLSGTMDLLGWDAARVADRIAGIADTTRHILGRARTSRVAPHRVADDLAGRLLELATASAG